jgi:hypothetical protein
MAALKLINKLLFYVFVSIFGPGFGIYFKFREVIPCYGFMEVRT